MDLKTFESGIYIPHYKDMTEGKSMKEISVPDEVVLPLSQHTGASCSPLVNEGDKVNAGDLIADSGSAVSARIHASVTGTVEAIEPRPNFTGAEVESIVIKPDGEQPVPPWEEKSTQKISPDFNSTKLSPEEIIEKIKNAGIVGMGGAAFPTHIKLSPPEKIDSVIINACECEPFLTCDHQAMIELPEIMLAGTELIKQAVDAAHVYIGIENNKEDAAQILEEKIAGNNYNMEVVRLDTKYPQGAEKQLIKAVIDREVPPGKLPFHVGAIVQNVNTAIAVYEAVMYDKPLIERIMTVSGDGISNPSNVKVKLGTPIGHVIEECGGVKGASLEQTDIDTSEVRYPVSAHLHMVGKIIIGGPMTGEAQSNLDVPVIKGTTGLLVFTPEMLVDNDYLACVRCAKCVSICPMYLYPNYIGVYAETGRYKLASQWGALDCFECGACTYVCPSKRPNVKFIREVKKKLNG